MDDDLDVRLEDAYCIIDDFDYADEAFMDKEDYRLYAETVIECGEKLRPLRDKYAFEIAERASAAMFADACVTGLENFLADEYGEDD